MADALRKKTSREIVSDIFNRKNTDGLAFWTGHPSDGYVPLFAKKYGVEPDREAIYTHLDDDCRWVMVERFVKGVGIGGNGSLANAETIADVERMYPWPRDEKPDFTRAYEEIEKFRDKAVFTGTWCPFFHIIADMFGMERYFIQIYENPKVVEAATELIVGHYLRVNEAFFASLGDRADVMFFGNDFGTQLDLLLSPEHFRRFILPSFKKLAAVGKRHGKKVLLHSCGSIYRIIPDLIEAGVDALHPIQAQAVGMSASDLAQYKNDLAFVGGIDAQSFIVNATPRQVADEVERVRELLGPNIVISPSHEEILPNVPPENTMAMARAAKGKF